MLTLSFTIGPKLWPELGQTHGPRGEEEKGTAREMTNANRQEEESLRGQLKEGTPPECPRCGAPLQVTPVRPRADVAYVRERALLACKPCGFMVALDRK